MNRSQTALTSMSLVLSGQTITQISKKIKLIFFSSLIFTIQFLLATALFSYRAMPALCFHVEYPIVMLLFVKIKLRLSALNEKKKSWQWRDLNPVPLGSSERAVEYSTTWPHPITHFLCICAKIQGLGWRWLKGLSMRAMYN